MVPPIVLPVPTGDYGAVSEPEPAGPQTRPKTPIAALRPIPGGENHRPTKIPTVRTVAQAGAIIIIIANTMGAGCGLFVAGMHGMAMITAVLLGISIVGMSLATAIAATVDGSRAVRATLSGRPVVQTAILERGAGQLSEAGPPEGGLSTPTVD